jgi:hypothetical protein
MVHHLEKRPSGVRMRPDRERSWLVASRLGLPVRRRVTVRKVKSYADGRQLPVNKR